MLAAHEIELIDQLISKNEKEFDRRFDNSIDKQLSQFLDESTILNSYKEIDYYKSLRVAGCANDTHFLIVEVGYDLLSGKHNLGDYEPQLIGLKKLDKNYGSIIIRPETLEDKLAEFFTKAEIDFKDYPKFSSKYYFLSDNKPLAYSFATNDRLTLIEQQREVCIEIKGDMLISKYMRILNAEDFSSMLDLIKKI